MLIALFPMSTTWVSQLDSKRFGSLLDTLAADGWVERVPSADAPDAESWVTAHDVLADQILLAYLASISGTTERFLEELLSLASSVGCLRSTLITLQRVVDEPELSHLDWPRILQGSIPKNPAAWQQVRDVLVRTSLLTPLQVIDLLDQHPAFWEGVEAETDFQNALGWLCRYAKSQPEDAIGPARNAILESWLIKTTPHVERSNLLLTWGLRMFPTVAREAALQWILARPTLFQTHYLLVAWLECALSPTDIAKPVEAWCSKFNEIKHLSFVVKAWLDAHGEPDLVRKFIKGWLPIYGAELDAQFVYKTWLDAKGEPDLVRDHIKKWLPIHGSELEAGFVYSAWLNAHGEPDLVRDHIKKWLPIHG
ncbi:MAG: hypothetical protein AAB393_09275, partial [Bacteroidota bacterium]